MKKQNERVKWSFNRTVKAAPMVIAVEPPECTMQTYVPSRRLEDHSWLELLALASSKSIQGPCHVNAHDSIFGESTHKGAKELDSPAMFLEVPPPPTKQSDLPQY